MKHAGAAAAIAAAVFVSGCILNGPKVDVIPGEITSERTIVLNHHGLAVHFAKPPGTPSGPLLVYATGDGGWYGKDVDLFRQIMSWGQPLAGFSAHEYVTNLGTDNDVTTPDRLARDYLAIISLAKQELELPANYPTVLVGVSRGAGLSVVAAGQRNVNRELAGVLSVALTKEEEYVEWFAGTPDAKTRTTPDEPSMVEVYEYLPRLGPLPLAVVQSTNDNYLPAASARLLFGPDNPHHRFTAIESKNHNFTDARQEMYNAAHDAMEWIIQISGTKTGRTK